MRKLLFGLFCLGCVVDLSAMNSVKHFCKSVGTTIASVVPQSNLGKVVGGIAVLATGYGVYKLVELNERVNELSRRLDRLVMQHDATNRTTDQFVHPIANQGTNGNYETRVQTSEEALQDRDDTIEIQNNTVNELKQNVEDLSQSVNNSTFVDFPNNNNESTPIKTRSVPFPGHQEASPIAFNDNTFDDNSSLNFSFDLNSSLSVSSLHIPEGDEIIEVQFEDLRYKGQGHGQELQGKGEITSSASGMLKIEGYFQEQRLVISQECPVCFKKGGTRFNFTVSDQCQPIVFELDDFAQFKSEYIKPQGSYLIHITNKSSDNFIFRPTYFYKGQVNSASHLPEGNGVMIMTEDGSVLEGEFKGGDFIKPVSKESSILGGRDTSRFKEKEEKDKKLQEDEVKLEKESLSEGYQPKEKEEVIMLEDQQPKEKAEVIMLEDQQPEEKEEVIMLEDQQPEEKEEVIVSEDQPKEKEKED